jgi:phosphatidylglycerophosphate synthase
MGTPENPALCIVGESGVTVFGLTLPQRLARQFAKEGVSKQVSEAQALSYAGPVIAVRADAVLDAPLIPLLAKREGFALLSEQGDPLAANVTGKDIDSFKAGKIAEGRKPSELEAGYWKGLRKRETPYAMKVDQSSAAEWRIFMGTYKGATDLVTKHVWPVPAFHATRFLAPRGVTPNMVTCVGAFCTVLAFYWFLKGQFVSGLAAAWLMTFLDTVDGKLARTTLTSSKWGDVFDHGIDLLHPPFWYAAWAIGCGLAGAMFWWALIAILGGYVLQRMMEGIAIKWLGIEIHIWRPIDTFFRQITARRNPNLIVLTLSVLVGRPDVGLIAVAIWTVVCLALHGLQLMQAFAAKGPGPLESWMARRA